MSIEEVPVLVKDNALEVGFIKDAFLFGSPKEEGVAAEVVDEPGDAFGAVVQRGDEVV